MAWCEECGSTLSPEARFCAGCGRAVAIPTETTNSASDRAGAGIHLVVDGVPAWVKGDWPAAAVGALIVLAVCLAIGVVYGAISALAATNTGGGIASGMFTGAYLPFAMFGVATTAVRFAGDATFGFSLRTLPLPLALGAVAGVYAAMRFAWSRTNPDSAYRVAFVAKLGVLVALAMALLAALLSFGDPAGANANSDAFAADVSVGSALVYPLLFVLVIGFVVLLRKRVRMFEGRVTRTFGNDLGRSFVLGALAFVAIAAALAIVVLIADVAVASPGRAKSSTIIAFFATGLNRGIAATVFAMGGAVERFVGHTSLFDWGTYSRPGTSTAPVPLFLWLGLAPAAVAYAALRSLDREDPGDEQGVVRIAAAVVVGFVIASTVLVLVTAQHRVAAGSPRAGFGLALFWAVLAGSGAGALWARSHNVRWHSLTASADRGGGWAKEKAPSTPPVEPTEIIEAPAAPPTLIDPATEAET